MNLARIIGPLAWAYLIIVGLGLQISPGGIDPIVYRVLGVVGILLGAAAFALSRRAAVPRTA